MSAGHSQRDEPSDPPLNRNHHTPLHRRKAMTLGCPMGVGEGLRHDPIHCRKMDQLMVLGQLRQAGTSA
jgi:hypothetical protein